MTKSLFEQMCDRAGAYEIVPSFDNGIICTSDLTKHYPPETAEMRERLEELVIDWCKRKKSSPICLPYLVIGKNLYQIWLKRKCLFDSYENSRPDALYSLIIRLLDERVLSAEEVKEAICGK